MKKMLLILSVTGIFAFANELQAQHEQIAAGCIETKLTEVTSILSCPSAEYKASFSTYTNGTRSITSAAILEKIGEVKPIILQQLTK